MTIFQTCASAVRRFLGMQDVLRSEDAEVTAARRAGFQALLGAVNPCVGFRERRAWREGQEEAERWNEQAW